MPSFRKSAVMPTGFAVKACEHARVVCLQSFPVYIRASLTRAGRHHLGPPFLSVSNILTCPSCQLHPQALPSPGAPAASPSESPFATLARQLVRSSFQPRRRWPASHRSASGAHQEPSESAPPADRVEPASSTSAATVRLLLFRDHVICRLPSFRRRWDQNRAHPQTQPTDSQRCAALARAALQALRRNTRHTPPRVPALRRHGSTRHGPADDDRDGADLDGFGGAAAGDEGRTTPLVALEGVGRHSKDRGDLCVVCVCVCVCVCLCVCLRTRTNEAGVWCMYARNGCSPAVPQKS